MSAQPDMAIEPILADPIRLALWRESTNGRGGLLPLADAFMEAANAEGGRFDRQSAWQLVQALTATQGALRTLPRWVAEAFAEVLHLDPSSLRPEGAPPPLRGGANVGDSGNNQSPGRVGRRTGGGEGSGQFDASAYLPASPATHRKEAPVPSDLPPIRIPIICDYCWEGDCEDCEGHGCECEHDLGEDGPAGEP